MSAILQALASVGNQYGQAKDELRQEDFAKRQALHSMDIQDARMQLEKQAADRQQQEIDQRLKAGRYIDLGLPIFSEGGRRYKQFYDAQSGGMSRIEVPGGTGSGLQALKQVMSRLTPEQQDLVQSKYQSALEASGGDETKAIGPADELVAKFSEQNQRHQEHEEDVKNSQTFQNQQREQERDWRVWFAKTMANEKGQALTPTAEKAIYTTMPVIQQVDRLMGDIDNLNLGNNNQSGYLAGARLKYSLGMASPEGELGHDIAGLSLGSVIEAASTLQGSSRSLLALRKALVHTPNPWIDSPMLIKQKLTEIRQRLQDVVNDAQRYGTKSGKIPAVAPPTTAPVNKNDPMGIF